MKRMKKVFAFLLTMVMVLAMAVPAMAASITINSGSSSTTGTDEMTEYTYYEIFKASIGTSSNVSYYIPVSDKGTALKTAIETADTNKVITFTTSADGTQYVVSVSNGTSAETLATIFNTDSVKNGALVNGTFAQTTVGGSATASNLDPGYYLVVSSLGTKVVLQTLNDVTVNEKNKYPTISKTDDKETASIGDTVNYTVTVTIPSDVAEKPIVIYDICSDGLTLDTAVTVTGATESSNYTSATFTENTSYTSENNEKQYTLTIPATTVKANAGKTLTFTYTATINNNAVVLEKETNDAYLKYDNYTTVKSSTDVVTYAFTLQKIDAKNNKELNGAEFSLWTAETGGQQIKVTKSTTGAYRVNPKATTSDVIKAGTATIEGLAAGTYYLQEDVAPTGYNKLSARKAITVNADTSATGVDISVENNAGTQLPSTGGIGTTLFYVIGAICVLGAGVLLVTRRRMASK